MCVVLRNRLGAFFGLVSGEDLLSAFCALCCVHGTVLPTPRALTSRQSCPPPSLPPMCRSTSRTNSRLRSRSLALTSRVPPPPPHPSSSRKSQREPQTKACRSSRTCSARAKRGEGEGGRGRGGGGRRNAVATPSMRKKGPSSLPPSPHTHPYTPLHTPTSLNATVAHRHKKG